MTVVDNIQVVVQLISGKPFKNQHIYVICYVNLSCGMWLLQARSSSSGSGAAASDRKKRSSEERRESTGKKSKQEAASPPKVTAKPSSIFDSKPSN
jgi:hypothetical protein